MMLFKINFNKFINYQYSVNVKVHGFTIIFLQLKMEQTMKFYN